MADGSRTTSTQGHAGATAKDAGGATARDRSGGQAGQHGPHDSHGHSTAAWTLVGVVLLGALVCSLAVVLAEPWLFFVGLGVIVVGAILGKVLQAMGFGQQIYDQDATDRDRQQGVR